ncbi:MAG: AmmeMemoRadiSam system protein A [Terriglobales bacterium]
MSPRSDNPELNGSVEVSSQDFTYVERRRLLALAHEAILSALEHREISLVPSSPRFATPRGAFTTIYLHRRLRGCVGFPLPMVPLYQAIIETARGAAFEDARFPAVNLGEALELEVSLSILSPLRTISPEEVQIGIHGLLASQYGRRGLLLPQVPLEHGWDRITFLEQTCKKAGLPSSAWQSGAKIEAFTAEIFGDRDRV